MRIVDLSALGGPVNQGIKEVCESLRLPLPPFKIDVVTLAYFICALRESDNTDKHFPEGKWGTIRKIEELITSGEDVSEKCLDRTKVAAACDAAERTAGWPRIAIERYGDDGTWEVRMDAGTAYGEEPEKVIDSLLKFVPQIKREKGYSGNIKGKAEYKGVPICISSVGKCEITYDEEEVEEDEMVKTGKKIKTMKKVAKYNCPDEPIKAKPKPLGHTNRKIRP